MPGSHEICVLKPSLLNLKTDFKTDFLKFVFNMFRTILNLKEIVDRNPVILTAFDDFADKLKHCNATL